MQVESNFKGDYAKWLRKQLTEGGVDFAPKLSVFDLSVIYWNAVFRRVEPHPRKVFEAPSLKQPPIEDEQQGLVALREKFELGHDVNPHRSERSVRSRAEHFHDMLFNDWGIHHFHLGALKPGERFVEGTEYVLFATVRDSAVYFIDVIRHKDENKNEPWAVRELLQTIHKNWPEVISEWKAAGWTTDDHHTDKDVEMFRSARLSVVHTMDDGTVYAPPGGGYMTTGRTTSASS